MIFGTIVKGDCSFIETFIEVSSRINENQIFSRVFQDGYNEQDVEDLYDDIMSVYYRFDKEKRDLEKVAATYNQQYATDCNGCYSDVTGYCFLIRRTMKGQLEVFKKFCAKNRKKPPVVDGKVVSLSALEHSDLGAGYTQKLIPFPEEEMIPGKLRDLANLIIKFNNEVVDCVLLCIRIMKDEMKIRKDYPRLRWIYDKTINELALRPSRFRMTTCPDSIEMIEDPMTREMLQTETDKWNEILAKYFHKRTPSELMLHYLLFTAYKEKHGFISTDEETRLWKTDHERIKKVRMLISFVDEKEESKGQRDKKTGGVKLNGKFLAKLTHWAIYGTEIKKSDFINYFNKEYHGKYQKVEYATVMAVVLSKEEKSQCIIEFENFLNRKKEEKRKRTA